jgi:beta-lactamase regulating signal transducer with metallopeptidase domain
MEPVLRLGLTNALMATLLAVLVACFRLVCRRPAVLHCLWLLVLLKLITPPLVDVPIPWPHSTERAALTSRPIAAVEEPVLGPAPTPDDIGPRAEPRPAENPELNPIPEQPIPTVVTDLDSRLARELTRVEKTAQAASPGANAEPVKAMPVLSSISWAWLVGGFWLAGSAWWFAMTISRIGRFQRLIRCAEPAPPAMAGLTRQLADCLGLANCPSVWLTPGRLPPLVWAFGRRARVLVPVALWRRLDDDQRAALLVHELAHLRRGDVWVRVLEFVVSGLFWWHPVLWWVRRELREAEEQCCDAWVVWVLPRTARAYATALVETVDFLSEMQTAVPVVASGFGHIQDLRRRLTMIMRGTTPRALSGAGFLAMLGLGALLLPLLPSWAQRPDDPTDARRGREERRPDNQEQEDDFRRFAGGGGGGDVDSARREVEEMRQHIEQMQRQLREATARLERAQRNLNERMQAEERRRREQDDRPRGSQDSFRPASPRNVNPGGGGRGGSSRGEVPAERRLAEVERKLDMVLEEVRSLRREMQPGQPGRGRRGAGTGMPGAGAAGGRPGIGLPGGGPGGAGGPPGTPGGPGRLPGANPPPGAGPGEEHVPPTPPGGLAPVADPRPVSPAAPGGAAPGPVPPTPAGPAAPGAAPAAPSPPDRPVTPAPSGDDAARR